MSDDGATVLVVGGGIAGVACARALHERGIPVAVAEQAATLGGRLGTRRFGDRPVDTGAAYFTVDDRTDDRFAAVTADWRARGLAAPWTDTLTAWSPTGTERKSGPDRWAARGGLRSLVADLAAGLDVRTGTAVARVDASAAGPVVDGTPRAAVVLAMPDPQAQRLLGDGTAALAAAVEGRGWEPVVSVVAVARARTWEPFSAMFVNDHPRLTTLADDGERRGDDAPVLVAHTTPDEARRHLQDPWGAVPGVLGAVREVLGVDLDVRWAAAHRWGLAQPEGSREDAYLLDATRIGLCGDGWGKSKVQTAWESGDALGTALADTLG